MTRRTILTAAILVTVALAIAVVVELAWHPFRPAPPSTPARTATSVAITSPTVAATTGPTAGAGESGAAEFGAITFATGVQGARPLDPGVTFPPDTSVVYALWSYHGMSAGTPFRLAWYRDGLLHLDQPATWDAMRYDSDGEAFVADLDGQGAPTLPPGNYRLELYIGERQVQVATFVVQASPPSPPPPTPTPTPLPSATPLPPTSTPEPDLQAVGLKAAESLVLVAVFDESGDYGWGSGSIVDGRRGIILTNWHVVGDEWTGETYDPDGVVFIALSSAPGEVPDRFYAAEVLPDCSDPGLDLALLHITHGFDGDTPVPVEEPLGLKTILLADSDQVRPGDQVVALGYADYADSTLAWTQGNVASATSDWLTSDALASGGNSGGMLINVRGELIGIPTQTRATSGGGVLSWSRPVNLARPLFAKALSACMATPEPLPPDEPEAGAWMMVLGTSSLNLRQGPSLDSPAVDRMPLGTVVELIGPAEWDGERYWYRVQVQDSGRTGWASEVYLASWDTATTPILFTSDRGGSQDIYRIMPDGSGLQQLTFTRGDAGDPSWSPDRSQFVFAYSEGEDSDLVITDATGVNRTWLTQDGARDIHPAWSPDGGRIAFVSDRDGDWEIYVYELVEMEWWQVTDNDGWDSYPAWSPDGDRIVYTSQRDGNFDLYLFDLSTGLEQRLTTNRYTDAHPSWSPVRDQVVYMAMVDPGNGTPQREIALLDPYDPDHWWLVTDDPQDTSVHGYPDWSPDGQWIVFGSKFGDNAEISLVPARGGPAHNLTQSARSGDIVPVWTR